MSHDKSLVQIIMGDFNSTVGEGNGHACMGKFGHTIRNKRGDELINFATVNDLEIINSHLKT